MLQDPPRFGEGDRLGMKVGGMIFDTIRESRYPTTLSVASPR